MTTQAPITGRAVVIGASIAGLVTARVLSDHFEDVLLLDRDDLPATAGPRARVPQGRQPHLLLHAGTRLLEGWYPGIVAELTARGAVEVDLCGDFYWHQAGGTQRRPASGLRGPSMSRPLLEHVLRQRVRALPNVDIEDRTTAVGMDLDPRTGAVVGVRVDGGSTIACDLLVDCSGRQARSLAWLGEHGYEAPPSTVVSVGTTYVSQRFRRSPEPARDWLAAAVIDAPERLRMCMALPVEGDEWIVMVGGVNGEVAPTDESGLLEYARTFPSSAVADLMTEPTSPVATHRFPTNQRRHVEKLRRLPSGWLMLGDAVCSFDPIYGQGMASAALQAEALGRCLARTRAIDAGLGRAFFRRAAAAVAAPWSIAVGGDFAYPGTTGHKPAGTDLLNRFTDLVLQAGQRDDAVVVRFNEVVSLVRSPMSLFAPAFVVRTLVGSVRVRRARRRTGSSPAAAPAL